MRSLSVCMCQTLLGRKAETHLTQRGQDRYDRREHFGDVDYSQTNRMGKLCCPYQMLEIPVCRPMTTQDFLFLSNRKSSTGKR